MNKSNLSILQVVFDCDGVLLESMSIKTRAFSLLAQTYGENARERMVNYHRMHGGVSRMEKFRWFQSEVLRQEVQENFTTELARRFGSLVKEELCRCPMVPGAQETLNRLRGRMPLHVCSGTPEEELQEILKARGLDVYFTSIRGTPPEKTELLYQIVKHSTIPARHTLMVGDALSDFEAAKAVGTQFYACGPALKGKTYPWSKDLHSLWSFVQC